MTVAPMIHRVFVSLVAGVVAAALVACGGGDGAGDPAQDPAGAADPSSSSGSSSGASSSSGGAAPPGSDAGAPDASRADASDGATPAYDAATWMGAIDDGASLAALSIPGTHESCAHVEPVSGTAKCQSLSLAEQMAAGVRYFDVRCRHLNDTFEIHHGPIYQDMNFDDVLGAASAFLKAHPTETLLMSVKEEYTASGDTRTFEQTFDAYVQKNAAGWLLTADLPALAAARGKIVLVRRFAAAAAKGIDATKWADDATFTVTGPAHLRVQDQYVVNDTGAKWTAIDSLFAEALHGDATTLYLNYTSGYKPLLLGVPNIGDVSNVIDPKLADYFTAAPTKGRYGVVAMDFVDAHHADLVLKTNF